MHISRHHHALNHQNSVTWGLAALRPCPALANTNVLVPPGGGSPTRGAAGRTTAGSPLPGGTAATPSSSVGPNKANPLTAMSVDNPSRKALYAICATACVTRPAKGDILSMDLSPKEDGQPVIMVTLAHNGEVLMRAALPCASIAALQMYPIITALPGMVVSLHEALTPSPLFTWYSPTSATADIQMADLDTCVKYNTTTAANAAGVSEFHGSTTFAGGRHRWTVQLDNMGALPGHIFVGLVHSEQNQAPSSSILAATLPQALAGRALGAAQQQQSGSGGAAGSPAAAAAMAAAAAASSPNSAAAAASVATTAAAATALSAGGATPMVGVTEPARGKWGVWVKLPGSSSGASAGASPPADGFVQSVESSSNHCCITVDLDLIGGYAKFFRNGHLLGSAFTGLTAPISPALGFFQGANQHLQAGLVNITKLQQLDLEWNTEACSGDLRIAGRTVHKVSEVFGDYSTVLANKGFISGVHLWLVKVNHLSEPDSIFIGVCRGCMPLDQDPQDLRDRTYYLSNGVIRVGGRRVATNAANFTKGDIVGVVLDADQGEIVFLRNGIEQGRARGIRGRLYPFVSMDSELDQITLLGACGAVRLACMAGCCMRACAPIFCRLYSNQPPLNQPPLNQPPNPRLLHAPPQPHPPHPGRHGVGHRRARHRHRALLQLPHRHQKQQRRRLDGPRHHPVRRPRLPRVPRHPGQPGPRRDLGRGGGAGDGLDQVRRRHRLRLGAAQRRGPALRRPRGGVHG